jgi:outer membrane lipoprotein-sorting protein
MRKSFFLFILGIVLVMALAGCGEKSQKDVTKALDAKVKEMTGYKTNAKLTLQTGNEPQVYDVEIWHKKPNYYRVNLKNAQKEQSQMILRNDEGVFVLTPALNKSFKFQSDWPQNSSQAYLFESLVKDILKDPEAKFKATKDNHYVFETKTNYQNNQMLPGQEITINKKDLSPVSVKIMDTDRNVIVIVEFSKFEFNAKFDNDAFDMKKNMTGAQLEIPVMAELDKKPLTVLYPADIPAGIELIEEKEVNTADGKRIVLTYGGKEKSFTLIQERAKVAEASTPTFVSGEPVDLGFTVGALSDNTLTWSYGGVEYMIASKDLSPEEMTMIARSVQGQAVK